MTARLCQKFKYWDSVANEKVGGGIGTVAGKGMIIDGQSLFIHQHL